MDVTLFATLDSITKATLDGVCATGYAEAAGVDGRICEAVHVAHAIERSGEFDLVHNHLDWLPLAFAGLFRAPLLTTIHGFSGRAILPAYLNARSSAYVSISNADRAPELDYAATVYHGIDLDLLPFSPKGGDALVAFGRIHPDKGTADSIQIASPRWSPIGDLRHRSRRRILLSEKVKPHIDGDRVTYSGSVGPERRAEVLGSAAALLHPIGFAEPFGLSVVEAMACGTPVIAYPLGSDAGARHCEVNRISGRRRRSGGSVGATGPRRSIAPRSSRRPTEVRQGADGRTYLGVYQRLIGTR